VFLVLAVDFFLLPLTHRDKTSYLEKLREADRRFHARPSTAADQLFRSDRARWVFQLAIWAWFTLTASQNAGYFEAKWKKDFLVPASAPQRVVLCTYGDNLILSAFDKQSKEVERAFSILKKGDDPKLELQWQEIGPLHLKALPGATKP
jgi:hypothetical protein